MKVCVVAAGPPDHGYGLEKIAWSVALAIKDGGAAVDFLFPGESSVREINGIRLRAIRGIPHTFGLRHFAFAALSMSALHEDYDVINTHGEWSGGAVFGPQKTRIVHTFHSTRPVTAEAFRNGPGLRRPLVKITSAALSIIERRSAKVASACVAVSPKVQAEVLRWYHPNHCAVISNEVVPHRDRHQRVNDSAPRIVSISHNDSYAKGIDVVYKVASLLPEAQFTVLGGRRRTSFRNVNCLGKVPPADVEHVLLDHDIFLCPSRYEGLSVALLEALASGLAVVCSEEAAPPDLAFHRAGLTIDAYTPEKYAAALRFLHNDLPNFSAGALDYAKAHDGTAFANNYRQIIFEA